MKNKTKATLLICTLIIASIINLGFKKYQKILTAKDVLKNLIYGTALNPEYILYNEKGWPDSTLITQIEVDGEKRTLGAYSKCYLSPADMYTTAFASLYTTEIKNSTPIKNFKIAFGTDLFKPALKMASLEMGTNKKATMNMFNTLALKQAFDKMYLKPTENFEGMALQKLYNTSLKDYMHDVCNVVADVMKKKIQFTKLAAAYKVNASTKKYFDGISESYSASEKLLGDNEYTCIDNRQSRIVGMLLRRQIDGSLPTVLACLKTIIKDYDPEFYTEISTKF